MRWYRQNTYYLGAHGLCNDVDFHMSHGSTIAGATMSGPGNVNGTYDQVVFTHEAVRHILNHTVVQKPLYIYLAYHNVHDACTKDCFTAGLNAPLETVNLYPTTKLDTWKVQAAMTTELDYGVGNITKALKAARLWDNAVIILVSDNGGPLDHSSNAPLRGGKASHYEGGTRVESFVWLSLLPPSVRGSTWDGMAHSSDWYVTCLVGIAGGSVPGSETGPRAPDGFNLWPALKGENVTSPRTEVIHALQNQYFNNTGGHCQGCAPNVGVASARFGDYKITTGGHCQGCAPNVGVASARFGDYLYKITTGGGCDTKLAASVLFGMCLTWGTPCPLACA